MAKLLKREVALPLVDRLYYWRDHRQFGWLGRPDFPLLELDEASWLDMGMPTEVKVTVELVPDGWSATEDAVAV
jgi:hypothetical protein